MGTDLLYTDQNPSKIRCEKLRKALIAKSYAIGERTEFVKSWCEKYGVFENKKKFNDYNAQELKGLLEKFNRVVKHRIERVSK
jgi:hypothetical protein